MTSNTAKTDLLVAVFAVLSVSATLVSLLFGKYPLTVWGILSGDEMQLRVFTTLRLSRALMGAVGGFTLGVTGFVFQTVFRNRLASPDLVGISSGASAGAAFGILLFAVAPAVTACSFLGALIAMVLTVLLSSADKLSRNHNVILSGICIHSLAQTVLMCLKLTADPERELASIEYWIMGSLNGISLYSAAFGAIICIISVGVLFLLHRQILILSADTYEATMLGCDPKKMRLAILFPATLAVSAVVSCTGLVGFVGLIAPNAAVKLTGSVGRKTLLLSGILGSFALTVADILARSVAETELPVSIFTSLAGAPFLLYLVFRGRSGNERS